VTDAAVPRLSRLVSRRRRTAAAAALAVGGLLLAGCGQTRIGSAAVVGDQRITDDQLQTLVDDSLSAPGVRDALPTSDYKGDLGAYRRAVLNVEVERLIAEDAAGRLGISVDENSVDARYKFFEQQSGGAGQFASDLASKLAVSPSLYRQLVRTEVIESEIGYVQGGVKRPTDAQLQALYQQSLPSAVTAALSLIQVQNEAAAAEALAKIKADPGAFATLAAQSAAAGGQSSAQPQKYVLARLPQDLVALIERARKNESFAYTTQDNSGAAAYFVIRSGGVERPTLASLRPQLEAQTLQQAAQAGQKYLAGLAKQVGVDISPRYGTWNVDKLSITSFDNPVIKKTPTPAATLPPGTGSTGGGTGATPTEPAPTSSPTS
jgi:peptidyl-prolyl cis-trans isomerase SurA